MRLQCDATVQYALPEHKARLVLLRIMRVDSPYNTYRYAGLAADAYRESRTAEHRGGSASGALWITCYYVAGPGGRHIFSRTLARASSKPPPVSAQAGKT